MSQQLVALLGVVLAGLVPVVRAWVQTNLTPQRVGHTMDMARIAVRAAEKLGQDVPGTTGAQKLNYASDVLVAGARRFGVKLNKDEVLAFVHAALGEMQQLGVTPLPQV